MPGNGATVAIGYRETRVVKAAGSIVCELGRLFGAQCGGLPYPSNQRIMTRAAARLPCPALAPPPTRLQASRRLVAGRKVAGILLHRHFGYLLVAPPDVAAQTPLATATLAQRLHIPFRGNFDALRFVAAGMYEGTTDGAYTKHAGYDGLCARANRARPRRAVWQPGFGRLLHCSTDWHRVCAQTSFANMRFVRMRIRPGRH